MSADLGNLPIKYYTIYLAIFDDSSFKLFTPYFSNLLFIVSWIHFFFEIIFPLLFIIKSHFNKLPLVL